MTLTLITINYNGTDDTTRLLDALNVQTDTSFDVIVVDNDSVPEQRERLGAYASSSPLSIDVVYAPDNFGFSGGNNIAIRKALAQGAEWILLINNDTTVGPDFISSIRSQLPSYPAVVGIPIREHDGTAFAGRIRWCAATLPHRYEVVRLSSDEYVIGAGMLIHRDVCERIGLLDEAYFLYFEDADYSLRARKHGFPVMHLRAPMLTHAVSATTKTLGSPLLLRYHMRNAIRFNRMHAPFLARVVMPVWLLSVCVKQVLKLITGRNRTESIALLRGLFDGIFGLTGAIRSRPVIAVECESLEDVSWGVAQQLRGWLNAFADLPMVREHYDIVAYFKEHIPDEPWLKRPHVRAVVVKPFGWLPASFSLYFFVFFPIRLWFDRPAVTFIANYMLPLIFRGRSIVMMTEDVFYEMNGTSLPFRYRIAYRIFSSWATRHATRIMAISHASAARVAELFRIPPERIIVNELGIGPARAVTPDAGSYILYVGQGLPRRHLRETIAAFAALAPRHPHLRLVAIGPDKYQPKIIGDLVASVNAQLGRQAIAWRERVTPEQLASAYAGAQLLVYVSDVEAFGLPPLEALSYRVPSVLMDTPVHRELFGSHAFYTESADPSKLAAVFERALTDGEHRRAIAHEAEKITARYTWEQHAQRMYRIIQTLT